MNKKIIFSTIGLLCVAVISVFYFGDRTSWREVKPGIFIPGNGGQVSGNPENYIGPCEGYVVFGEYDDVATIDNAVDIAYSFLKTRDKAISKKDLIVSLEEYGTAPREDLVFVKIEHTFFDGEKSSCMLNEIDGMNTGPSDKESDECVGNIRLQDGNILMKGGIAC